MNLMKKLLASFTSQIKKSDVKLPVIEQPHKIKDDNQSIHNGVINEKTDANLRGSSKTSTGRKRSVKPKRET